MKKNLKKSYEILDLPYSSTIEDVESRKKAMIKVVNSNTKQKVGSKEKEIALIENSARAICDEIKTNGIPNCDEVKKENNDSILWLIVGVIVSGILCFFSFL